MSDDPLDGLRAEFDRLSARLDGTLDAAERAAVRADIVALFRRTETAITHLAEFKEGIRDLVARVKALPDGSAPQSVRHDHLGASTYLERGWSELASGHWSEAETLLRQATTLDGMSTAAPSLLAWALMHQGRLDEALKLCQDVLRKDPDGGLARVATGAICLRKGLVGEGIEHLTRAATHPGDSRAGLYANFWLGVAHVESDRHADAVGFLRQAVTLGPNRAEGWVELGRALWFDRRPAEAREAWIIGAGIRHSPHAARCTAPASDGCRWRYAATFLVYLISLLALQGAPPQAGWRIEVGEITALMDRDKATLGTSLAEAAEHTREWAGLGRVDLGRLTLVLARDRAAFAAWSHGSVPDWGAGATLPGSRVVLIRLDAGDPFQTLRHELAHVALHRRVSQRLPLWFDEGYAVVAAGEFDRFASLRLNLAVATGHVPGLRGLDAQLRGSDPDAQAAYALAGSAVAELARRNPTGTLEPLMQRLEENMPFDDAVLATTGLNADRFDEAWHQVVRQHYNWVVWLLTGGAWLLVTLLLVWAAAARRHRDAPRRAALDIGWPEPPEEESDVTIQDIQQTQLDPPDPSR